ncbi:TolC family protein [Sunxiuqinia elliptica]
MKINTIITTILILSSLMAKGQMVVNIDTCRIRAVKYSEEMLIAQKQLENALYAQKEQRSNYFPKVNISGTYLYTRSNESFTFEDIYLPTAVVNSSGSQPVPNILLNPKGNPVLDQAGNPIFKTYAMIPGANIGYRLNNSWYTSIGVDQPIYMGGKIKTANKMASLGVDLSKLNQEDRRQAIVLEAEETYWTYVAVIEQVKVAHQYLSLLDSLNVMVSNAVDAGLMHRNELLKVQVKHNEAQMQCDHAENSRELLRMSLCRIMGVDLLTDLIVADTIIDISPSGLFQENVPIAQKRTDFQILKKQIELQKHNENLIRSDFLPQIGIRASYDYLRFMEITNKNTDGINKEYLSNEASPSLMATISIPLFQWGEGRNKIKQAKIKTEIANAELEKYSKLMCLEINQAKLNLSQAYNRNGAAAKNLEQAEENMKFSKRNYNVGMELLTDYLEAQAQWQSAFADFIKSKTDCKIAYAVYQKAIGNL